MGEDLEKASALEERIPENVIETSVGGMGYSIGLHLNGLMRDLDVLTEYFMKNEGAYSALGLYECAKSRKVSPMMLWKGFSLLVKHETVATLEMFNLWSAYSIEYLGEAEGEQYISKELGVPLSSASEQTKLDVFVPKRERGGGSLASI